MCPVIGPKLNVAWLPWLPLSQTMFMLRLASAASGGACVVAAAAAPASGAVGALAWATGVGVAPVGVAASEAAPAAGSVVTLAWATGVGVAATPGGAPPNPNMLKAASKTLFKGDFPVVVDWGG